MNLYCVFDDQYEWCCFVFANTRNQAKSLWANAFDQEYTSARCKTLKRDVNAPVSLLFRLVDSPDDKDYHYVTELGFEYSEGDI